MMPHPSRDYPWLTLAETGQYLRLSRESVRRLIRAGQLTPHRVGRRVLVARDQLEQLVHAADSSP
jgi:excisionase family DNA binding protein